ncbi:MAG: hypothetical protein JWM99_4023 [Verrucomicrobiales bacterium]|nr:hypothetical protein [Verrucomicrobiales bacterium]
MSDETPNRSAEIRDPGGSSEGSTGEQSPLQVRAAFLKNWDWQSVVSLNRGACERGGAQHGTNSESIAAISTEWGGRHIQTVTLADSLDYLRNCHRRAPFLFFNGNTFADIGRTFSDYLFAEMPTGRRREATSAIAHYIAGVLDRESMIEIVESLCETAHWNMGDRIKTLRGSTHGKILRLLADNRVVWQPDGSEAELIALPESLVRE